MNGTSAKALASACAGVLLVVACSSPFAPADPPDGGGDGATTEPEASSADGAEGPDVVVPSGDAAMNDASTDANAMDDASTDAAACLPPKKPNGEVCAASTDCCSGACASNSTCKAVCAAGNKSCNALMVDSCCVGLYCSQNAAGTCASCHPNGMPAEVSAVGAVDYSSCCSGHVDSSKSCAP